MRQRTRASHTQCIERGTADRERVGGSGHIKSQRARHTGGDGIGPLRRVVETGRPNRGFVAQAALHLIGHGERHQQIAPAPVGVLAGGQHGRQVVARVARLPFGQVAVVVIEVPDERAVVERCVVWRGPTAADQCANAAGVEFRDLVVHELHGLAAHGPDRTPQRVEHADLQLIAGGLRQIVVRGAHDELSQALDLRHAPVLRESQGTGNGAFVLRRHTSVEGGVEWQARRLRSVAVEWREGRLRAGYACRASD